MVPVRQITFLSLFIASVALASACSNGQPPRPASSSLAQTRVTNHLWTLSRQLPHDRAAFTQGLQYHDGFLYESTGLYGSSSLRRLDPETGQVLQRIHLPRRYFGEGIAIVGDRIIMLTWREQTGFVFRLNDFELLQRFSYEGEGWGLAYDGRHLIMSDGTAILRFLDPDTFHVIHHLEVMNEGEPLPLLNELAVVEGLLWANVLSSDRVACIDMSSGQLMAWLDLSDLRKEILRTERDLDVLNGIAYDPETRRIWVTGKRWPAIFQIRLGKTL